VSETLGTAQAPFARAQVQHSIRKKSRYLSKDDLVCRVPAKSRCVYLFAVALVRPEPCSPGVQACLACLGPVACRGMVRKIGRHTLRNCARDKAKRCLRDRSALPSILSLSSCPALVRSWPRASLTSPQRKSECYLSFFRKVALAPERLAWLVRSYCTLGVAVSELRLRVLLCTYNARRIVLTSLV
jgi:hypothetical protein